MKKLWLLIGLMYMVVIAAEAVERPNLIIIVSDDQGYATALIGKWHLGLPDSMMPTAQGFETFSGIPLSHVRYGDTYQTSGENAFYRRQWKTMGVPS